MGQIPNESCMSALCLKLYVYGIMTIAMCVCVCVCVCMGQIPKETQCTDSDFTP